MEDLQNTTNSIEKKTSYVQALEKKKKMCMNCRSKCTVRLKSSRYTYGEYPFRPMMQLVLFVEVGTRVEELLAHVLLFV